MKTSLLITILFLFQFFIPAQAQRNNQLADCQRQPAPTRQSTAQVQAALTENKVAVYYVVASDETYSQAEYDAIKKATREIQAWFQVNTGGLTYTFAYADTVLFYQAKESTSYYREDWWGLLLAEMEQLGHPIWEPGFVVSLWIKSGRPEGLGGGAQSCNGYCGVAITAVENFPEFNDFGICPTDPTGLMWPCVPHGTMAHELGHAFGLPHPYDHESTRAVAYHSIMQTHWSYPDKAPDSERPWGLLTVERTALWSNPFFYQGLSLRQIYDSPIVNLPVTGEAPLVSFRSSTKGLTVNLTNETRGAWLYYWTFGDGSVSNATSPSHTYSQPGTYTITLRASNENGMMAMQRMTVQVAEDKKPVGKPIYVGPIKIYPNPSTDGRFTISFPTFPFPVHLSVHNAMGRPIIQHTFSSTSRNLHLDLSDFGRGIYYVRIQFMGASFTHRLSVL
ncbi:zinc-dependent metalloprotease [Pontibacter sp. BAB1700]|uniref:zinc-dependent metalloprotease n=1 Tax=Pontibacter sp. BAB1700 TaxID=1144253 RepID=UPI00026BDA38|nr:zinc-dependent metalloprotease [Pontibacter sp. BAB1700]EJF09023.1 PDK repeat-containing protein [Pontibacter sp. BAB1700]